jgi:restriction system protein
MSPTPTIPSRAELLQPTLRAVSEIGGSGTVGEIDNKVIELAGLTEDQQAVLHGNGPRTEVQYQLAWSRTYLKAMGLLENSARGVWTLTDLKRFAPSDDMTGVVPAAWRHETNRLPPQRPRSA